MYRNAFLQANELNSGVPSIRRTDASGKAPSIQWGRWGDFCSQRGAQNALSPSPHPPQLTPGRHMIGRRCAPVCPAPTAVNTTSPPCSTFYLLRSLAAFKECFTGPTAVCSLLFSPLHWNVTVPVPGHPEPGVRERSGCPPSGFRWPLRPLSSLRSTTTGLSSGKKGGSFPRPNTSLGMRFRALTLHWQKLISRDTCAVSLRAWAWSVASERALLPPVRRDV